MKFTMFFVAIFLSLSVLAAKDDVTVCSMEFLGSIDKLEVIENPGMKSVFVTLTLLTNSFDGTTLQSLPNKDLRIDKWEKVNYSIRLKDMTLVEIVQNDQIILREAIEKLFKSAPAFAEGYSHELKFLASESATSVMKLCKTKK